MDEFSTNHHVAKQPLPPTPHRSLSFHDGNIAILSAEGTNYFMLHREVIALQSPVLETAIKDLADHTSPTQRFQDCPILNLDDPPDDLYHFFCALYSGISSMTYDTRGFLVFSAVLRLATKYQVHRIRLDIISRLSRHWPDTLREWDLRERDFHGLPITDRTLPHPIQIINLAQQVGAEELLPAAFYDLSRDFPSVITQGYFCPFQKRLYNLERSDLSAVLKGREHASRYFSTFIVNHLEGREGGDLCENQCNQVSDRTCQIAFEALTLELLRDVNGVVCKRTSDPLFAMLDSMHMLQSNCLAVQACQYCCSDFSETVNLARREFWTRLPEWFAVLSTT